MFTFKDRFGDSWDVLIDMATAARLARWDFSQVWAKPISLNAVDGDLLKGLQTNAGLLVAMVYAICKPVVDERFKDTSDAASDGEPSPREMRFLKGFDGETIENARTALFEALANFFPQRRTVILDVLNRSRAAEKEMEAQMTAKNPELVKLLHAKGEEYINQMLKKLEETSVEELISNDGATL